MLPDCTIDVFDASMITPPPPPPPPPCAQPVLDVASSPGAWIVAVVAFVSAPADSTVNAPPPAPPLPAPPAPPVNFVWMKFCAAGGVAPYVTPGYAVAPAAETLPADGS